MKMRMITTALAVFTLLQVNLFATNGVDIRFATNTYDNASHTLYVDIQVRTQGNQLVLAGQNYRIYYDASALSLKEDNSKLLLPVEKYSSVNFHTVKEGIDARGAGQLDFDENLGFANFSIDLINQKEGGLLIEANDHWYSVATLEFKVLDLDESIDLIWGRENKSESYATAYVEMAEWLAPKKIKSLRINEYVDFNAEASSKNESLDLIQMSFGPNPSRDIVKLTFTQEVEANSEIVIRDVVGREVLSSRINESTSQAKINISSIPQGNYIIELRSKMAGTIIVAENLVKM